MKEEELSEKSTESMEDYAAELEASYKRVHTGDIMKAKVVSADEDGLLVDLDYFMPGKIAADEISNDPSFAYMQEIQPGDIIEAMVTETDDGEGFLSLSMRAAATTTAWEKLSEYQKEGKILNVKITETVKGGAVAYVENVRAFIPASRLALTYVEDLSVYQGQTIAVKIAEVNEQERKVILSARELLREQEIAEKNRRVNRIKVNSVVEGTVQELRDYGAFVDIGDGVTGLLHISEISMNRIKHPQAVLSVGQKVRVKIIKVAEGRVSLSMKELEEIAAREEEENMFDYKSEGDATTSLAGLLKGLKLD